MMLSTCVLHSPPKLSSTRGIGVHSVVLVKTGIEQDTYFWEVSRWVILQKRQSHNIPAEVVFPRRFGLVPIAFIKINKVVREIVQPFLIYPWQKQREGRGDNLTTVF